MPRLNVADQLVAKNKSDALVVLAVQDGEHAQVAATSAIAPETREHLDANLLALAATGAADEIVRLAGVPGVQGTVVVSGSGLPGAPSDDDTEALRRAAGAAIRALAGKAGTIALAFPSASAAQVTATAEGALYGSYAFTSYKSNGGAGKPVSKITVLTSLAKDKDVKTGVKQAQVVADERAWAQDLVNTPPLDLYPESFAAAVKERFAGTKVKVKVLDEKALAKESCGGLIGVGRGSARPPRMVVLSYEPARAKSHISFVGKGITFDSGGLCIKPAEGMITMKCDMAGAAAVAAATKAIADLGLPVAVTTYLCLAENLTGSDAQRPGDVVTMPNGRTVEIINTDAEGRLVMADGLALASRQEPDLLIDVATLTGAAVLSLGTRTAAVLGNDDAARDEVVAAAGTTGEDLWPIPLLQHLRSGMKSLVADTKHTGARQGGMIVAALFLQDFVGDDADGKQLPWAHLDIAGPAYSTDDAYGYVGKGASGYGVRTLVQLAQSRS
ncbi:putative cytosol aminopeptidase [Flexivirga endophytica]|uniref:Probable cytosol aminopeptidase n=1 Tax=Flexivirga endophytica TaxID=1849103 RepID=A0A916SWM9_9MICO|nr:leucyl aminopeptidase [Flexivirga endophytica]GGB20313.1 putative cytosol aminopeptidase [Flexivirga endophytica]GHB71146.1 putative cytosol aminopeptidase [Flexivirga endophytica]